MTSLIFQMPIHSREVTTDTMMSRTKDINVTHGERRVIFTPYFVHALIVFCKC